MKIIWHPEHVGTGPMIIVDRGAVNDHCDLRQLIDRTQAQWIESHPTWEPAGEVGIRSGLAAIRVGGNETRHGKIGILHQTAAQRLADHMLSANLTPAFDGDAAQDDPFAMTEMHR
jgi:hypothetical protein